MISSFINVHYCYTNLVNQISVGLLMYAHIPAALLALFFGIFILCKTKNKVGITFFIICVSFAMWCFLSLCIWFAFNSAFTMFTWSLIDFFGLIMFFFSYYFFYTFVTEHDLPIWQKITSLLLLLPTAIWTFFGSSLTSYDSNNCTAIQNNLVTIYPNFAEAVFIVVIIVFIFNQYKKIKDSSLKKKILLTGSGILLFLIFFFSATLLVNLLSAGDASTYVYNYEIYGLFGMPILLAFLVYTVVKLRAFNIKLLGIQVLVWSSIILIGSEFFFIQNNINMILTAITLILTASIGLLIVCGVKREILLRESLEIANKGQENLIHIMNHQIKGFFGITRNIFAELLQSDDYGHMPEESKPLLEKGLESTSAGVNYVQDILRGSSAEKGVLPYDMKPVDIKPMVLSLLSEQKDIAIGKGLSFESNISDGNYNIIGDEVQLREAFKNLITNAIKYNDYNYSNRGIKVYLSHKNNKIVFSVRDTGVGISDEDKTRLFTAGGMGKNSIKLNVEASGFGLAFVKGVAEAHKGIVGYKSNKPEKGTTFYIELPLNKK